MQKCYISYSEFLLPSIIILEKTLKNINSNSLILQIRKQTYRDHDLPKVALVIRGRTGIQLRPPVSPVLSSSQQRKNFHPLTYLIRVWCYTHMHTHTRTCICRHTYVCTYTHPHIYIHIPVALEKKPGCLEMYQNKHIG